MTHNRNYRRINADDADIEAVTEHRTLAYVHDASADAVAAVLSKREEDDNGRSGWVWLRLSNGDLILGVFPHGDTYFDVEVDAEWHGRVEGVKPVDDPS